MVFREAEGFQASWPPSLTVPSLSLRSVSPWSQTDLIQILVLVTYYLCDHSNCLNVYEPLFSSFSKWDYVEKVMTGACNIYSKCLDSSEFTMEMTSALAWDLYRQENARQQRETSQVKTKKVRIQVNAEKVQWAQFCPLENICLYLEKSMIWKDTCTWMFIAALFITAKAWKQTKCPSAES